MFNTFNTIILPENNFGIQEVYLHRDNICGVKVSFCKAEGIIDNEVVVLLQDGEYHVSELNVKQRLALYTAILESGENIESLRPLDKENFLTEAEEKLYQILTSIFEAAI